MRFGSYFAAAIAEAGYSQRAFAIKAKHQPQSLNQIILGKRAPPLKHIATWMAMLKDHIDPEQFLKLAVLENCPAELQKMVAGWWK